MNKWIAEFELEDGDTMPEHMDLEYKGVRIDFHCKPQKQDPCNTCEYEESGIYCKEHCPHEAEIEQEPCEDAISRQAVKEQMIKYGFHAPDMTVTEFVEDLPPVTPQQKTAHWIFDDECKEHGHCSRCGYGSVDLVDGEPHNFCRKCGAKMVEPQERSGEE